MFRQVSLPDNISGKVYLNSMPGRYGSIQDFLSEAEKLNISRIISLTDLDEIGRKSPAYAEYLQQEEKSFILNVVDFFPIEDFGVPSDKQKFFEFAEEAAQSVLSGENILVHCAGGVGRTGMFANCLLLAMGLDLKTTKTLVKDSGSDPETSEQKDIVRSCEVFLEIGEIGIFGNKEGDLSIL